MRVLHSLALVLLLFSTGNVFADTLKTERVVLITVDGLRHQELFGGFDPMMLESEEQSGIDDLEKLKEAYWRDTPEARREALFPFFWGEMIKRGAVIGNPLLNSHVRLQNLQRVSFPGYAEILTGRPQLRIWSNDRIRNERPTVLEYLKQEMALDDHGIAAFCSWDVFNWITAHKDDALYTNAGYEAMREDLRTPGMAAVNELQFKMLTPWDSVRFDEVTWTLAHEYLKANEPKVLYLALGETDDWAHNRRYDRVLFAANLFDRVLRELWETLQSLDAYRDKTTILITSDHGRGSTLADWTSHGIKIEGSEDIWMAAFGPDTPKHGEMKDTEDYVQGQMAATVAAYLGLDYTKFYPEANPPVDVFFEE